MAEHESGLRVIPNMVRGRRTVLALGAVLLMAVHGCARVNESQGDAAVDAFHAQVRAGQLDRLYASIGDEFKERSQLADLEGLLEEVRSKIGDPVRSTRKSFIRVYRGTGLMVNAVYETTYERGAAEERFDWSVRDGALVLLGYHINVQ